MTTYKDAGVDIDAANTGLKKVKKHAKKTFKKDECGPSSIIKTCNSFIYYRL